MAKNHKHKNISLTLKVEMNGPPDAQHQYSLLNIKSH